ncbi:hypothetical protein SAMN02910317_02845 [Ruminococcaceae bacterium FB2012]|nr:hypothetical protein SAMN02910317_02845 [Ruminococcaceae bacterium FB2012]
MDKAEVDIYQKTRHPDTWKWVDKKTTNSFSIEKKKIHIGHKVALVLSLTAEIGVERITNVFEADTIYFIRADRQDVDCIRSLEDLSDFWHKYQIVCDDAKNVEKAKEICVFPAMPVSAAFEVGRRYMPKVYPKLRIYDDSNGFVDTNIIIGEE